MQIHSVTGQPNFKGKVIFKPGTTTGLTEYMPATVSKKIKEVAKLVEKKDYDIFVSQNEQDPNFYNIAANKTFNDAQKVKEYTVKIQSSIMAASFVDAAKDAMEMYEKFIAKGIKG